MGSKPRILYLGDSRQSDPQTRDQLAERFDVQEVDSPLRALADLANEPCAGVYVDSTLLGGSYQLGKLLEQERILEGMPDGVVLLDSQNTILWGNPRMAEWFGHDPLPGSNFYQLLESPEILSAANSDSVCSLGNCQSRGVAYRPAAQDLPRIGHRGVPLPFPQRSS